METVTTNTFDIVRETARRGDADRFVAALLAPRAVRDDLIALAAFAAEVRRIGQDVRDVMAAEIRLQWWRDALKAGVNGHVVGQPVADAVSKTLRRHGMAPETFDDYLDAHAHALYSEPPQDAAHLFAEIDLKEGTLMRAAARMLSSETSAQRDADAITAAAKVYGLTRVALDLPYALARGRQPLPDEMLRHQSNAEPDWRATFSALAGTVRAALSDARPAFRACQPAIRPALLPVALVEPYLRALEKADHDPARDIAEIAPLTRMWRMYAARAMGRV